MQERFPESTLEDRDILLGSYIFLRFYSPAIITPEYYGILTNANTLSLRVRRNLLHVLFHEVFRRCGKLSNEQIQNQSDCKSVAEFS